MISQKNKKGQKRTLVIAGSLTLVFLFMIVLTVNALIRDDGVTRRRQIQMVTLVKPPPPPKIKEKPPEPEIKKKEEIIEQQEEIEPEELDEMPEDDGPMDDDLGLDADGVAGADGFGLKAKKGGHALIGSNGNRTLMQRYGWYARIIQEEIRKKINDYMAKNGGVPQGEHKALVEIVLDSQGRVVDFKLRKTSGNNHMDEALQQTLATIVVSEMPPEGMPRSIQLRVSSKG